MKIHKLSDKEIASLQISIEKYEEDLKFKDFKEIFYRMKSSNVDIYEELIPFKYIIKKVDNNLYYESFSFLFNSSIEK